MYKLSTNQWAITLIASLVLVLLVSTLSACGSTSPAANQTPTAKKTITWDDVSKTIKEMAGVLTGKAMKDLDSLQSRMDQVNADIEEVSAQYDSLEKETDTIELKIKCNCATENDRARLKEILEKDLPKIQERTAEIDKAGRKIIEDFEAFEKKYGYK